MTPTTRSPRADRSDAPDGGADVLACETCPGRAVFVETGNPHGWIATDLTVEPGR